MDKKNKHRIYFLLFVILSVTFYLITGCTSVPKPPDCINKSALNAVLSWGESKNGEIDEYYILKMNGEISKVKGDISSRLSFMPPDSLCEILKEIGRLIIEVQSLNVPADHNNFIMYKNPDRDYFFRALWNPEFDNSGNRDFKKLYSRLDNLIDKEKK
ncbi:MAG: hypothetical protein KIT33_12055 [Candidatus Kapabacteria bacterium]|nr:hypothetical protein [Ignavibacteriota bacterium]MCW5885693.1 hypothetical protein [Candidatus Kapabacteria bacterium]